MNTAFDFYNKQWHILTVFKEKLDKELQRYAEQPENMRRKFVFQLNTPVSLEELPILLLKLKGEPVYASRLFFYSGKEKVRVFKEIENFLKTLRLEPVPKPSEITKILLEWEAG
jgi:hypothetical protein